ncbi:DUF4091 domain-containing protein [Sphingobacterium sp. CZ-2]|uniref:DUF4091 domain-containing protein n=1 Tax=Sphingobacterium sp. CZ-2 TaxID=2557994 RepID=UPI001070345E|nr:DUF4091 domain-containing protein [Sphingobacterium sp. CZ-2]QBR12926.1 DUF4091 domain-containing protein [Sphingobacterium sp. CZ-2]
MFQARNKWITLFSIAVLSCQLQPAIAQQRPVVPATFQELPDPTSDVRSDWSAVKSGLHSSFVSIDKRYPKSVAPQISVDKDQTLIGWKGERVSAQVLIWSAQSQKDLKVEVSDFKGQNNSRIPSNQLSARFIRYVMTDEFASGCGHRKPEDFASSLSPDMLDNLSKMDLDAKTVRPVWITVNIPTNAKPGKYEARVSVSSANQKTQQLSLSLEVLNVQMPKVADWTFHLDQWQHPSAVARVEGLKVWSDEHFEAMKPIYKPLAEAGQKVITATLNKDPWNVQTYDPYEDMILWTKQKDGSWAYDYQIFDRWVQFMMDMGVNKMINCYSIIPWNNEIHYQDQSSGKLVNVVAKPGTPIFEELWTPFLKDFVKHLQGKGWLERTNIAIDERERAQMDAAFSLMKRVAPELGISYADNQKTYQRYPDSEDISIAVGHPYSLEDLIDRRNRGLNSTFYICCSDAFPNQFTFSDPAESTYLGWYALASGFDGLLRWAYNSWVENPLQDSRFRTWPAGDTYIIYPKGRSSIRFERMLEGIQDYEKVLLLQQALQKNGDHEAMEALANAIAKLNNPKRFEGWNSDLNKAKSLLNELSRKL